MQKIKSVLMEFRISEFLHQVVVFSSEENEMGLREIVTYAISLE